MMMRIKNKFKNIQKLEASLFPLIHFHIIPELPLKKTLKLLSWSGSQTVTSRLLFTLCNCGWPLSQVLTAEPSLLSVFVFPLGCFVLLFSRDAACVAQQTGVLTAVI